jgi:preprotein translocase subunit SecG
MIIVLVVHILLAAFLVGIILIQKNEGGLGGLGGGGSGSGGMGGLLAGRTQANLLTRTTAVLAAAFFVTSIALAVFSSRGTHDVLVPEVNQPAGSQSVPVPATNGSVLPGTGTGSEPALPAAPAPAQPAPAKPAAPAGQ